MKFGKNLARVVDLSDPEWAPFWINYKYLKKKIKEIVKYEGPQKVGITRSTDPQAISKSALERAFFRLILTEMKKVSDFFRSAEQQFEIRRQRVREGFRNVQRRNLINDPKMGTRVLMACVKFYRELLLLENFAIMNFCGFSKILKKHDKITGYRTREAFMRKVVSDQPFTHYTLVLDMLQEAEILFTDIQRIQTTAPLQDEERLFIEAIRCLNLQASRLQTVESGDTPDASSSSDDGSGRALRMTNPISRDELIGQQGYSNYSFSKSALLFPEPGLESQMLEHSHSDHSPPADHDNEFSEEAAMKALGFLAEIGRRGLDSRSVTSWIQQVSRGSCIPEHTGGSGPASAMHVHVTGSGVQESMIGEETRSHKRSFPRHKATVHAHSDTDSITHSPYRDDSLLKRRRAQFEVTPV